MSSTASRRPVFRLTLGYPILTIAAESAGAEGVAWGDPAQTEIDLSKPSYAPQLRALSVAIRRARGVLRVVLPEGEVWRGLVDASAAADPMGAAGARAAAALGRPREALVFVTAARLSSGETPVAAAPRDILAEARGFLRRFGLRPAAFAGAGAFPGFPATPRFPAGVTPSIPGLASLARLARAARPRLPMIADLLPGWPPTRAFVAGSGLALACAAVAFIAVMAPEPGLRTERRLATLPNAVPTTLAVAPAALETSPVAPPPLVIASALAPALPARAESRPRRAERDLRLAMSAPAPARAAAVSEVPARPIAMSTRNMPELEGVRIDRDMTAARVAELVAGPRARSDATVASSLSAAVPGSILAPRSRPASASAPAVGATGLVLDDNGVINRPVARPGTARLAATAPAPAATVLDPARPRPRVTIDRAKPLSPAITAAVAAAPVRVAALVSATPSTSDLVAATLAAPPEPRPAPMVRAAPVKTTPAPVITRAPEPARSVSLTPRGDVARPAAQPARVAVPQTIRVQPAQPSTAQRQVTQRRFGAAGAAKAIESAGISRGGVSLLGVFGTKTSRRALIRLPDGSVTRVRAGDSVQGARVASVSADSVRLTGSGRDVILKIK
jgi:hypothetical protein